MNPKTICKVLSLVLLSSLSIQSSVHRAVDIGGGSGHIKSPYTPGKPVLDSEVARVKNVCTRTRVLRDVPMEGTHVPGAGTDVGLASVSSDIVSGTPSFAFKGTSDQGDATSIDFSEVQSFTVVQRGEKDRVLIEVVQFPVITPKELIERSPSYSDLVDHYTKSIRVWMNTKLAAKELCLVGKDETGRYRVIAKLNQIPLNTKVDLDYGMFRFTDLPLPVIWWATESVTRDSKYPYRNAVLARD